MFPRQCSRLSDSSSLWSVSHWCNGRTPEGFHGNFALDSILGLGMRLTALAHPNMQLRMQERHLRKYRLSSAHQSEIHYGSQAGKPARDSPSENYLMTLIHFIQLLYYLPTMPPLRYWHVCPLGALWWWSNVTTTPWRWTPAKEPKRKDCITQSWRKQIK